MILSLPVDAWLLLGLSVGLGLGLELAFIRGRRAQRRSRPGGSAGRGRAPPADEQNGSSGRTAPATTDPDVPSRGEP